MKKNENWHEDYREQQQKQKNESSALKGSVEKGNVRKTESKNAVMKLVRIVFVFIIINAVIWGGQELYYWKDTKKIHQIEKELDNQKIEINPLEWRISYLSSELDSKKMEIDKINSSNNVELFNSMVDNYNELLKEYKAKLDIYNNKLSTYNSKVEEVNILIKKSGTRFYLIPIPIPGRSVKSRL